MITVIAVPPAALIEHWDQVEPLLQKAMPVVMNRFDPIHILANTIQMPQLWQSWLVLDEKTVIAVAVTVIEQYPKGRSCSIFALGSVPHRMREWWDQAHAAFYEFAARTQCKWLTVVGRPGWKKALGQEAHATVFTREVQDGLRELHDTADGGAME